MKIGKTHFDIGARTFLVGILNLTPDSFSDGGSYNSVEQAVNRAKQMVSDGADIIEIGGESTRPGHVPVETTMELERVIPVLDALIPAIHVPISIDTRKAEVAEIVLSKGAAIINDTSRFKDDPGLARVCAKHGAVCCAMHSRDNMDYGDFLLDVIAELNESVDILRSAGVTPDKIILDPGIGFAKNAEHNLEIMQNLSLFTALPYPIMLGTSRKRFIGHVLDLPVEERLEGTIATSVLGVQHHCAFIRVHDVKENKRAIMMADAIVRRGKHCRGDL